MFFVLFEKLKSEEGKLDALASSILHHCGHFLGAEARFFAKLRNRENSPNAKNDSKLLIFNGGGWVLVSKTKKPLRKGYFLVENAPKIATKMTEKTFFFARKMASNPRNTEL